MVTQSPEKLEDVLVDATVRCCALHGKELHLQPWQIQGKIKAKLANVMTEDWKELLDTLKDAIDMGEPIQKAILNTYCNSWAVKVLKS